MDEAAAQVLVARWVVRHFEAGKLHTELARCCEDQDNLAALFHPAAFLCLPEDRSAMLSLLETLQASSDARGGPPSRMHNEVSRSEKGRNELLFAKNNVGLDDEGYTCDNQQDVNAAVSPPASPPVSTPVSGCVRLIVVSHSCTLLYFFEQPANAFFFSVKVTLGHTHSRFSQSPRCLRLIPQVFDGSGSHRERYSWGVGQREPRQRCSRRDSERRRRPGRVGPNIVDTKRGVGFTRGDSSRAESQGTPG